MAIWVELKTVVKPSSKPKNSAYGPLKKQKLPKVQTKFKGRIEGNLENKSCSAVWVDAK